MQTNDSAPAQFIKLIVKNAADQNASKIVLGRPCEPQCPHSPLETTPIDPPWDAEDKARFSGCSEHGLAGESQNQEFPHELGIPLWFKVGDAYTECSPFPAFLLLDMLQVMKQWDSGKIPWADEKTDWNKLADLFPEVPLKEQLESMLLNKPLRLPAKQSLSSFLLRLSDGRIIQVSLGFEPSFCFSLSLHDTGRTI